MQAQSHLKHSAQDLLRLLQLALAVQQLCSTHLQSPMPTVGVACQLWVSHLKARYYSDPPHMRKLRHQKSLTHGSTCTCQRGTAASITDLHICHIHVLGTQRTGERLRCLQILRAVRGQ